MPQGVRFRVDEYDSEQGEFVLVHAENRMIGHERLFLTKADFDRDGLDDVLVMNENEAFVISAADVNDETSGFAFYPSLSLTDNDTPTGEPNKVPASQPAVGDLDGDGNLDVAWMGGREVNGASIGPKLITVCSGVHDVGRCEGRNAFDIVRRVGLGGLVTYCENPVTPFNSGGCSVNGATMPAVAVAIGRFADVAYDTLFLLVLKQEDPPVLQRSWYEVGPNLSSDPVYIAVDKVHDVRPAAAAVVKRAIRAWGTPCCHSP